MKKERKEKLFKLKQKYKDCRLCSLCERREKVVFGRGGFKRRVVIVGEVPGPEEDKDGRPFIGRSGRQVLDRLLRIANLERNQVYITNSVLCYPGKNPDKVIMTPTDSQIKKCNNRLNKEIEILKPKTIVALGNSAFFSLTGKKGIEENRGNVFSWKGEGFTSEIIVTYHPSAVRRNKAWRNAAKDDFHELGEIINAFR